MQRNTTLPQSQVRLKKRAASSLHTRWAHTCVHVPAISSISSVSAITDGGTGWAGAAPVVAVVVAHKHPLHTATPAQDRQESCIKWHGCMLVLWKMRPSSVMQIWHSCTCRSTRTFQKFFDVVKVTSLLNCGAVGQLHCSPFIVSGSVNACG